MKRCLKRRSLLFNLIFNIISIIEFHIVDRPYDDMSSHVVADRTHSITAIICLLFLYIDILYYNERKKKCVYNSLLYKATRSHAQNTPFHM